MTSTVSDPTIWRGRANASIHHLVWVVCVSAIYLITELNIWGLSFVLASAQLQYFASIVGMIVVFFIMSAAGQASRSCDNFYHRWIKSKVDFINAQLGVGFSVPIIMLDHVLGIRDIGYIIATSAITNVISWIAVFILSLLWLWLLTDLQPCSSTRTQDKPSKVSSFTSRCEVRSTFCRATAQNCDGPWQYLTSDDSVEKKEERTSASTNTEAGASKNDVETKVEQGDGNLWHILKSNGYVILCLIGITGVGLPLELVLRDSRVLDGFSIWLCWLVALRLQRMVKCSNLFGSNIRIRHSLATMINPVLVTTLLMLGFTRLKGLLAGNGGIAKVLGKFSSGSPIYAIWTASISGSVIPDNPTLWFGAGDLALSLLECGIVTWGFKLYECRRQLFSVSGILILLFSTFAAAGNTFLSVLLARTVGLQPTESLAFAARSTTLALAKPAVKALGGNLALNATLVVSNGILGQLLYPMLLDKLSIPSIQSDARGKDKTTSDQDDEDGTVTVAAGTAIGINGAAMGVSYLYEVKSRAAPYAALSMTMFGVMNVVFTTLDPFKAIVLKLASW